MVNKSAGEMLCFNVHSQVCGRAMFEGQADSTGVKITLSWPEKLIQVLKVLQLILKRKESLCTVTDILFPKTLFISNYDSVYVFFCDFPGFGESHRPHHKAGKYE